MGSTPFVWLAVAMTVAPLALLALPLLQAVAAWQQRRRAGADACAAEAQQEAA